jgi:serine/threonine protein kinase
MAEADDQDVKLGGDTTRMCPDCGAGFAGERHEGCPGTRKPSSLSSPAGSTTDPTIIPTAASSPGATTKPRLDDMPAEVRPYADDSGRRVNQYVLVKQIGKGGMGAVWKAWDRKLTRWVAVKFLLATEDEDVLRFQREAKLAARLRHPNIAPIYEVGEVAGGVAGQEARHYLAMEYIDGMSMASALELPLREKLEIFQKVASGVEAAHRGGVVHRDLKPQNVMLTSDKWPYVMDFGLAKALQTESSLSVSGAVMGTPAYMPPEQAQGQLDQVDAQSDVYSLGATMYAVLVKKQPFQGQSPMEVLMKVCKDDPPRPRAVNPEIPEPVERIIVKAMSKVKADRYPSAGALGDDLKRFLAEGQVDAAAPTARKTRRSPAPLAAGALLLVAAAAGAFVMLRKPEPPPAPPPTPPAVLVPTPPAPVPPPSSPAPPVPDPAELQRKEKEAREQKWISDWLALRPKLAFERWTAADAALGASAADLLKRMEADANVRDVVDATEWVEGQTRSVLQQAQGLGKDRALALKVVGWCDALGPALKGSERLGFAADQAGAARTAAAKVAAFRGSVTLRLLVGPWAEVVRVTREGKDVALAAKATPLVVPNVEIGDLEVELSHPQHGRKVEKIPAAKLKDGKTYVLSGRMQDPALRLEERP